MAERPLRILFIASEAAPFSKTGGLGEVAGALPRALVEQGLDVRVFTPRYRGVDPAPLRVVRKISVPVSDRRVEARILAVEERGVTVYLVDAPSYFDRERCYGERHTPYPDNAERFAFFARAAMEFCRAEAAAGGFVPDVLHANDWQAGLVPVYLRTLYARDAWAAPGGRRAVASVMTAHNLGYQGAFWHLDMHLTGLGWDLFTFDKLESFGRLNYLKGGLVFADLLSTVSPTYAREILTAEHGRGLEGLLRHRAADLRGILNGVDDVWDPSRDEEIAVRYDADGLHKKAACTHDLLRLSNLPEDDAPVVAMIGRLAPQKGGDLALEAFEGIIGLGARFVLLGTGDPGIEEAFRRIAVRHPLRTGIHLEFHEDLAHQAFAGADILLVPSRYEPCGLSQMIAMRYGTVPVARRTGGLADTIEEGRTGFLFDAAAPAALLEALGRALEARRDRTRWDAIRRAGMESDFTWTRSARAYADLYRSAVEKVRGSKA